MEAWLASTDAEVTFVGGVKNFSDIATRSALSTTLTVCSHVNGNLCSGPCTVFTGNGECINTPGTNCLAATTDVSFCNKSKCGGTCNLFSKCGVALENGFCDTPGTNSVSVPQT